MKMKKKVPPLLSYSSKNIDYSKNHKIPLSSRFSYITDLHSSPSNNKVNKSEDRQSSQKSTIKTPKSLYLKNLKIKKKLLYVFKDPKEKYKKKFGWPKITHPKLPFSERKNLSPEEKKKKIMEQKPSHLFHDFHTIKWLRQKYTDSVIEKSISSMLPDNGKPVVPEDESESEKKHRLLMEYLDSLYNKGPEREKYVNINPKYFYDKRTFEKILKFKAIFLEFDEDLSRKMEIDEMVEMFNQNHINANLLDLKNLFFKGKKVKKEDIMKLYLDFYQFMNFALTKDQDFREFMREIKSKNKENKEENEGKKNNEENNRYLPMNFNLMFDYFLIKGKERASIEAIENSMNEMDKIINNKNEDENENEVNLNNKFSSEIEKKLKLKRSNSIALNKNKEEDLNENSKFYDDQLKNLNFCELMENFTNLFKFNNLVNNNIINEPKKKVSSKILDILSSKSSKNIIQEEKKVKKKYTNLNKLSKISIKKKYEKIFNEEDGIMKEFIKNQMNKKIIKNLNFRNYKKYNNIKLALSATKDQVKQFIKSIGNDASSLYKIDINDNNNISNIIKVNNNKLKNYNSFSDKNLITNNNSNEKNYCKDKNYLLFNKTFEEKKLRNEKRKGMRSYGTIGKLSFKKNNKNFKRNEDKLININTIYSYYTKNNFRTNFKKVDYVPPELLKNKINDK